MKRFYTILDCQNGVTYDCACVIGDDWKLTDEQVLKKNMLVRNEQGVIIRIVNRGCFEILPVHS